MTDFNREITNYKNYGIYIYKFDDVGNELVNPSSSIFQQVYFSLPFGNVVYNNSKIESFYDVTFKEFVPQSVSSTASVFPQEAIDQINAITSDNLRLQNELLSVVNSSEQDSSLADAGLVKNIIINLRIQLGQGTTASDFDTVFPYMPIPLELRDSTTSAQVVPSSAASTVQPTIITATSIVVNTAQPGINESGDAMDSAGQPIPTPSVGQLTDSEIAAISASMPTSPVNPPGTGFQYVFVSKDFGSIVINGVTYFRLVYMDMSKNVTFDLRFNGPIRVTQTAYGHPIHGKYVNVTDAQFKILQDKSKTININGITYQSVIREAYSYWGSYDSSFNNGQTAIQNYECYNGPNLGQYGRDSTHFPRSSQIGKMGALGPA